MFLPVGLLTLSAAVAHVLALAALLELLSGRFYFATVEAVDVTDARALAAASRGKVIRWFVADSHRFLHHTIYYQQVLSGTGVQNVIFAVLRNDGADDSGVYAQTVLCVVLQNSGDHSDFSVHTPMPHPAT